MVSTAPLLRQDTESRDLPTNAPRLRSPLRWVGSKRRLVASLLDLVPARFDRYFEPFAGSAALFFAMAPANPVLGDINPELMNAYRVLADQTEELVSLVHGFDRDGQSYYLLRAVHALSLDPLHQAANSSTSIEDASTACSAPIATTCSTFRWVRDLVGSQVSMSIRNVARY